MAEGLREFLMRWWNEEISPMLCSAKIRCISDDRLKKFRLRSAEFANLPESIRDEAKQVGGFARERGFITFDFLMAPSKLLKFLEGNYRERTEKVRGCTTEEIFEAMERHRGLDEERQV